MKLMIWVNLFLYLASWPLLCQTYPPYWDGGAGANHPPVAWPDEVDWVAYTSQESEIEDRATQDPSNGGTRPQNYVNVSSGCQDFDLPSIYWTYNSTDQVIFSAGACLSKPTPGQPGPHPALSVPPTHGTPPSGP